MWPFQQEIAEAAAHANRMFKEKYPEKSSQWNKKDLHDDVLAKVRKVKKDYITELKKRLLPADTRHTPEFLNQVKFHFEKREDDREMLQEKLCYLATS